MRASHRWLMELSGLDQPPAEVAARLTAGGVEVESMHAVGVGLDRVVIADVRGRRPHPQRERLQLVRVYDGESEVEVVCGAPNVPGVGARVVLARVGAALPGGLVVAERDIAGVRSLGMLVGEVELGVGADAAGILDVTADTAAAPGTPVVDALALHDTAYELSLTPNRPDCLGHLGLARELCVLFDRPFAWPEPEPAACLGTPAGLFPQANAVIVLPLGDARGSATGMAPVRVDIRDELRCPRYAAALVVDVGIAESPFAVRYRLHVLGQRAISNVVDATNLILLGFGHPIHAFDYDRLRGSRIEVRLARAGEVMRTLDGVDRTLTGDDLLICDGAGPVALAGVMGGEGSGIGPDTRRVLIECAYFDPRSVRRTSKRTGIHTDASHRFERGVDASGVPRVLAHAASLIARLAGGAVVSQALDVTAAVPRAPAIVLRQRRIEAVLGDGYEAALAERLLSGLGCEAVRTSEGWQVHAPGHRPDLTREIDLIEELARLRGYDTIPTALPALRCSELGTPEEIRFVRRAREAAAAAGLDEAIHYAFVSPAELVASRVATDAVRIANPLSEERSRLRTALLPGLAAGLRRAQRQRLDSFAQFELGRVFEPRPDAPLPAERYVLAFLLWGPRRSWYTEDESLDLYDAKGAVERIVTALGGRSLGTAQEPMLEVLAPYLHPRRRAQIRIGSEAVGHVGELHPDVARALALEGRPVIATLEVEVLRRAILGLGPVHAHALPRFPAVTRDIAVVVPEAREAGEVALALRAAGGAVVEQVRLFDIYRGVPVPEGHKSLAFHVVYRVADATLTDETVDGLHASLVRAAEERFGATLRR